MADLFDNSKPNIILIADVTDTLVLGKSFGIFKVAQELRLAGYEVAVISHAHIFSYDELKHILSNLISNKTLFVGINNMFYKSIKNPSKNERNGGIQFGERETGAILPHGLDKNIDFKKHIKSLNQKCCLVLGGPVAYDSYENKEFDYIVLGYADISAVNLANFLEGKESLIKSYKSLYGPVIIDDKEAKNFDFVNSTMQYKSYDCILPKETLPLEVSRGCIFQCAFCSYPLNGKNKLDFIKLEELLILELLDNYKRFNVTRYLLLDDTFNDSVEKVEMIHRISKRLPFKLEYWAYLRLDLLHAHPETIELLYESGLRGVQFGIETFNKQAGSIIGKGLGREKQIETLRQVKKHWKNVTLYATFITGLPGESIDSLFKTFEYLTSKDCDLESWAFIPLSIKDVQQSWATMSKIDKEPEKYGYTILRGSEATDDANRETFDNDPRMQSVIDEYFNQPAIRDIISGSPILGWKSNLMNSTTATALASYFQNKGAENGTRRINGLQAFQFANDRFDLEQFSGIPLNQVDWHAIDLDKQRRAKEYKTIFYEQLAIPEFVSENH